MGLEFLGNPYENDYDDESDFEIERDEEWVVPIDTNLLANRQLLSLSDEGTDFSLGGDDEDDEDFNPDDSLWDDDDGEEDFDGQDDTDDDEVDHDDDDIFQNPDGENYPEYDEIEDVFAQHSPGAYGVDEDDFFDDEDDLDYVTYPIEIPKPSEQPEKTTSKNTEANNSNTNNSESATTNSAASEESHND